MGKAAAERGRSEMIPAPSYKRIQEVLTPKFVSYSGTTKADIARFIVPGRSMFESRPVGDYSRVVMVGVLFAPPHAPLTQKQILHRLPQFHYRAGSHIDFFCA